MFELQDNPPTEDEWNEEKRSYEGEREEDVTRAIFWACFLLCKLAEFTFKIKVAEELQLDCTVITRESLPFPYFFWVC